MYSNQKDQINLEQVYINIHNDEVVEEGISGVYPDNTPLQILGVGAVYATLFLPVIIDHLMSKYPQIGQKLSSIKDYLKDKISKDKSLDTMKQNADDHGGSGSDDYYRQINQKIANDIKIDQTFRSAIENGYEQAIVDDIINLLPKNVKDENRAQMEVKSKIQQDLNKSKIDTKRRQAGLPPLRTIKI